MNLMNQARENPLAMAAIIGKDPEQVVRDFPEKKTILQYGIPPVVYNKKLQSTAGEHAADMLANTYFAYQSIDGRMPVDRMIDAGYQAEYGGETLGMIGFRNLIKAEEAVWAMFKNMYAAELDPNRDTPWKILNPSMTEVGVTVEKGAYIIGGQAFNVYLGVCDFGTSRSDTYAAARMLMKLINTARGNPGQVLEYAGMGLEEAVASVGRENGWVFLIGLPPLAWNLPLHNLAQEQARQLISRPSNNADGVFSESDGLELLDTYGYTATTAREVRVSFFDDDPDQTPVQASIKLFNLLLEAELSPDQAMPNIFNASVTEIGAAVECAPVADMQGCRWSAVIEFARPVIERQYIIGGLSFVSPDVSDDTTLPEAYNLGRQLTLMEFDEASEAFLTPQVAYSGPLGGYQFEFNPAPYEIRVIGDQGETIYTERFLSYHHRNQLKDIIIEGN